jgi:sucrose-6-phosphate hydrolase SacC (GH32 family)
VIVDGQITQAHLYEPDVVFYEETYVPFFQWVVENHPEAGDMFWHHIDEMNMAKWEQYFPEWLASLEDAG